MNKAHIDKFAATLYNPDRALDAFNRRRQEEEDAARRQALENQIDNYGTRLSAVGQEVPEKKNTLNNVLKALSALDKPRAALWGGVAGMLDGDDSTSFGSGLKAGWKGEQVYRGTDLVDYLFGSAGDDAGRGEKFARGAGGFVLESLLDPLSYLTTGAGSLAKGAITGTGKSLTRNAATMQAAGVLSNLKREALEGTVNQAVRRSGMEFSDAALNRMTTKLAKQRAGSTIAQETGQRFLGKGLHSVDDVTRDATTFLANRMLGTDTVMNSVGRGLSFGTRGHMFQPGGLTNAKMQDLGAAGSKWVRENTGFFGQGMGAIQDTVNNLFRPSFIKGLDGDQAVAMRFFKRRMEGDIKSANEALVARAGSMTDSLIGPDGRNVIGRPTGEAINAARKQDRIIAQAIEKSVGPNNIDELTDAAQTLVNTMKDDFMSWGISEKHIGALSSDLLNNYFPHVKSWSQQELERSVIRGGVSRKMGTWSPNNIKRQYGNNVFYANQAVMYNTSDDVAKEAFERAVINAAGEGADKVMKDAPTKMAGLASLRQKLGYNEFDKIARETLNGFEDYFEVSALSAYVTRGLQHNKVIGEDQFLKSVLGAFGDRVRPEQIGRIAAEGSDVIIPKASLKVFGLSWREYNSVGDFAKIAGKGKRTAARELPQWEQYLRETDDALAKIAKDKAASPIEISRLMEDKMAMVDEIERLKGLSRYGLDPADLEKMPPKVSSLIERIIDPSSPQLVRLSADDAQALVGKHFIFEAYQVPNGVIDYINTAVGNQKATGLEALTNVIDGISRLWKPTVTGLRPDFHLRNTVGSTQLNLTDIGFKTFDRKLNRGAWTLAHGKADDAIELAGQKFKVADIRNAMHQHHARATFMRTDVSSLNDTYMRGIADIADAGKSKVKKGARKAVDAGMVATDFVEGQVRGVNYLANMELALEKGLSVKEAMAYAGSRVQMFHFDYTDLTRAEREIFRRVAPFYTFARKNLPLQAELMLNKPALGRHVPRFNENMDEAFGTDGTNVPDWMKNQMSIAMPFFQSGDRTPYTNMNLPLSDVTNLGSPGDIGKMMMGMLAPWAKFPLETTANRTMLTGAPIWRNEEEKNMELLKHVVNQFGVFRDGARMFGEKEEADGIGRPMEDMTRATKLIRGYSEESGEMQSLYEYNRELGNRVQYLNSQDEHIPDTDMARLMEHMGPSTIEVFKETGQIPPSLVELAREMRSMGSYDPLSSVANSLERMRKKAERLKSGF